MNIRRAEFGNEIICALVGGSRCVMRSRFTEAVAHRMLFPRFQTPGREHLEKSGAARQWRCYRMTVNVVVRVFAAEGRLWRGDRRTSSALQEPGHHRWVVAVRTLVTGQTSVRTSSSLEETAVHALALAAVPVTREVHVSYLLLLTFFGGYPDIIQ